MVGLGSGQGAHGPGIATAGEGQTPQQGRQPGLPRLANHLPALVTAHLVRFFLRCRCSRAACCRAILDLSCRPSRQCQRQHSGRAAGVNVAAFRTSSRCQRASIVGSCTHAGGMQPTGHRLQLKTSAAAAHLHAAGLDGRAHCRLDLLHVVRCAGTTRGGQGTIDFRCCTADVAEAAAPLNQDNCTSKEDQAGAAVCSSELSVCWCGTLPHRASQVPHRCTPCRRP